VGELTLVTALFDLATREGSDRHPPGFYLERAQWLLGLDRDLVVFCDPQLAPELRRRRAAAGRAQRTVVVARALEAWAPPQRVAAIAAARERHPLRNASPIKDTPLYTAFVWAKFAMVVEALDRHVGGDGPVAWIDLGLAGRPHPDDDPFAAVGDRIDVLMMRGLRAAEVVDRGAFYEYLHGHIAGGYIAGAAGAWRELARLVAERMHADLADGYAPSDEQLLTVIAATHPQLFAFHHGGYGEILPNAVHLRGSAANLAFQLRHARAAQERGEDDGWIGPSGFELARRVVESLDAGLLQARGVALADLLDECFMAAFRATPDDPRPAAHVRDLYLDAVRHDPELRDAFLLAELRVRGNFAFVER
jgi:hypothetical protein